MNRRARLPGADELFRATGSPAAGSGGSPPATSPGAEPIDPARDPAGGLGALATGGAGHAHQGQGRPAVGTLAGTASATGLAEVAELPLSDRDGPATVRPVRIARQGRDLRPTGRERHEEKITVYCSPEELLQLEQARLSLRGAHGLAVDRGRIVREAVAVVLADLEAKGESSILVRRLRGR
jgi:hypothetical protein